MVEFGEVLNLVIDILFLIILLCSFILRGNPLLKRLIAFYSLIILSHTATILEGFFSASLLDIIEHTMFGVGALGIAVTLTRNERAGGGSG